MQAAKQVLDRTLPNPVSYADLCAIAGAVGVYATKGPLLNVGYGRPDATSPDPFQGVGSNTNQQRDYPIQEIINEWGELHTPCTLGVTFRNILLASCKPHASAPRVQPCHPRRWLLCAAQPSHAQRNEWRCPYFWIIPEGRPLANSAACTVCKERR